jgi:hypothetical protein
MPLYKIRRGETTIATIWPEGQQEKEIMLKDEVPISFKSPAALYFQIGDTIQVYGETYYLNALDEPTKDSTLSYRYQMNFVASYYALAKPKIFFYDSANALKVIKFEAMITPRQLLDLIVANANRTQSGWVAGDCIDAPPKMLTFNGESLLTALDIGAKEFETEWWPKNKVLHLTKKGAVSGYHFEYGYDKGLRGGLSRTNVDSSSVFSRLYVTGSDQNLPVGYRNGQTNLQLPADTEYIQGPKYGDDEIEAVINFDDIKPERIGTVSSVTSPFVFSDSGIDFDLNEPGRLLPGVSVKVSFLTGNLAGYNFDIAKGGYNHATRSVTIIKNEVEKALQLPSDLMKPAVGDTYFFFDLVMPASYVTDAENRVKVRGQEYFDKQSVPRVAYDLPADPFFFARNNIVLTIGDYVHVKDTELLLDKDIRVYSYSRDLHDGFKYGNLKVSDMPIGSAYIRQIAAAEKITKALAISQVNNIARARANWRTTNELTTLLETVQAEMFLSRIEGGAYTTNISSTTTVNHFQTVTGNVYHEQFKENDGIWHVPAFQIDLNVNVPYHVYIKASKNSTSAEIIVSEDKITVDVDPAFYYLPFGIISSIFQASRDFTSTRGYSKMIGGLLDTGRIVSHDGTQYWDLDGNLLKIGTALSGLDWGVTEAGTLTISGRIVATNAEFVNLAVQNLRTAQIGKRIEIKASENNLVMFDHDEKPLIILDDDSATEGIYSSPNQPITIQYPDGTVGYPKNYLFSRDENGVMIYYYSTMGPGISAGLSPTDPNGFSSFGRKKIQTSGEVSAKSVDELKFSRMDQEGIETTGNLRVRGTITVDGEAAGKTGYVNTSGGGRPPGSTTYTGLKVEKGKIVDAGTYNWDTQPPILS